MKNKDKVGVINVVINDILNSHISNRPLQHLAPLKPVKSMKAKETGIGKDYALKKAEGAKKTFKQQFSNKMTKGFSRKTGKRTP